LADRSRGLLVELASAVRGEEACNADLTIVARHEINSWRLALMCNASHTEHGDRIQGGGLES